MVIGDLVEYDGELWEIMFVGVMQLQLRHLITDEPHAALLFDVVFKYHADSAQAQNALMLADKTRLIVMN